MLYQCDHVRLGHTVVPLDLHTPIDMRAPGAAWGMYALECAMDELAYKLNIDPLELRLKNYAERDQNEDKPFSSKELRECYRQGAEKFGWAQRHPQPRSMREGDQLIGWGMATGVWEALYVPASAKAVLTADGKLDGEQRNGRHRHRNVHDHDANRGRNAGPADGKRDVQTRRFLIAASARRRRFVDGGYGRLGGQGSLRGGARKVVRARAASGRAHRLPTRNWKT